LAAIEPDGEREKDCGVNNGDDKGGGGRKNMGRRFNNPVPNGIQVVVTK